MKLFVTGTDTNVGKTLVASALLHQCRARGFSAIGMKPVAAGSGDVDALIAAGSVAVNGKVRTLINPYFFREPIAPHIAAAEAGVSIDLHHIAACFGQLSKLAEAVIVEGAGGFLVPLGTKHDSADLARLLGLQLVLVVGMRLGCINHALLTQEAIKSRGLTLAGWIANRIDPDMDRFEENLDALKTRLSAPLLGVIPFLDRPDPVVAAACLELPAPLSGDTRPGVAGENPTTLHIS